MNFLVANNNLSKYCFAYAFSLCFAALAFIHLAIVYRRANAGIFIFLMVGATRGTPTGFGEASGSGS